MSNKAKALLGQLGDTNLRLLQVFRTIADGDEFSAVELELNIIRTHSAGAATYDHAHGSTIFTKMSLATNLTI